MSNTDNARLISLDEFKGEAMRLFSQAHVINWAAQVKDKRMRTCGDWMGDLIDYLNRLQPIGRLPEEGDNE